VGGPGPGLSAARAREEMQFLAEEPAAAVGPGAGTAKTAAERARVNITWAIRAALARIPALPSPATLMRPSTPGRSAPTPRSAGSDHLAHLTAGFSVPFIAW